MGNGTVRKFKLWWAWQDERHEQWLESLAAQGLHLLDANAIGMHTFARGAPADVAYRWDIPVRQNDAEYLQLFQDAGWEHVATAGGWHCWRKTRVAGAAAEIFTDSASRISKYQTALRLLSMAMLAQSPALLKFAIDWRELLPRHGSYAGWYGPLTWFSLTVTPVLLYCIVMVRRRIRAVNGA
ncbi:DUF2812 domain-containing protein [Rugamonas sp. FT82W]|uniref:DUF2812 domain-containing protein n=1 Tax=Duganella vulcania TaxID=2692166 RepID=A0A845FZ95_9BURK|nr:DUF2812 domain-containing protein [Duganella vulcania]MYM85936.1 DUF2812 domain-containing protein [Duganella vulcania]